MRFVYCVSKKLLQNFKYKTLICSTDFGAKASNVWWLLNETRDVPVVYNVLSEN